MYLNVNMSISPPCVHTFMYSFKVTCNGLSCVTEQKEFWRQYFVALTNSSSTVMLKYLFPVPSLHSGNISEGRKDWIHSNSLLFFSFKSTNLKWYPYIIQGFFAALNVGAKKWAFAELHCDVASCMFLQYHLRFQLSIPVNTFNTVASQLKYSTLLSLQILGKAPYSGLPISVCVPLRMLLLPPSGQRHAC